MFTGLRQCVANVVAEGGDLGEWVPPPVEGAIHTLNGPLSTEDWEDGLLERDESRRDDIGTQPQWGPHCPHWMHPLTGGV